MFSQHFHGFKESERHSNLFGRFSNPFERHSRLFKRGEMKYVILTLLKDKPSHGYELSLALEERFHGLYSPSPGSIYPVLQLLEDMGYVTSNMAEGKKVYMITDSGKKFLEDQKETVETIERRLWGWLDSENQEYLKDIRVAMNYIYELNNIFRRLANRKDPTKITRVNEILAKTLKDIEQIYQER